MNVIMDTHYAVGRLSLDVKHNRKNFLREASKSIAKILLENGCLIHDTEYNLEAQMYQTNVSLYIGHKERWLP